MVAIADCRRIDSVEDLKRENGFDGFILLNGNLRSSKSIDYNPASNQFEIWNMIDGEIDHFSEQELMESFIGKAIKQGALFEYPRTKGQ